MSHTLHQMSCLFCAFVIFPLASPHIDRNGTRSNERASLIILHSSTSARERSPNRSASFGIFITFPSIFVFALASSAPSSPRTPHLPRQLLHFNESRNFCKWSASNFHFNCRALASKTNLSFAVREGSINRTLLHSHQAPIHHRPAFSFCISRLGWIRKLRQAIGRARRFSMATETKQTKRKKEAKCSTSR